MGKPGNLPTTRGPGGYMPPTGGTHLGHSPQNRAVGAPQVAAPAVWGPGNPLYDQAQRTPARSPAEQAFIDAINAGFTPEQIQTYAGAVGSGIPPDVAGNPSAYGYDYANDPTGLGWQRNQAFIEADTYDYRTDPGFMALESGLTFQSADQNRRAALQTGNLDVLQPMTESDILADQDVALRGVDSNYEARGLYNSGERALGRADTAGDYQRQLSSVQTTGALQRGNIQSDLAAQLADIERRRADATAQYSTAPLPRGPGG